MVSKRLTPDRGRKKGKQGVNWDITALALGLTAVAWVGVYTLKAGVPPTPLGPRAWGNLLALVDTLPAHDLSRVLYLGSAWGGHALALARRLSGADVLAFELSPLPFAASRLRQLVQSRNNIMFWRKDFFKVSLADADLLVCYLFPDPMTRLKTKMEREMKSGAYVLSAVFAVPGWTPIKVSETGDIFCSKIYLYQIGKT